MIVTIKSHTHGMYLPKHLEIIKSNMGSRIRVEEWDTHYYQYPSEKPNEPPLFLIAKADCGL